MPEYTIQDAETGRELIVEGAIPPTPADMEELFAAEYQREELALAPPVEEVIPEALVEYPTEVEAPEVEDQSFLRSIADVPLQVGMGGAYGVRAITEAFGANSAVAENIRGIEDYLDSLLSAQSKADSAEVARLQQEAEDKGFGPQVLAALKGISIAPIDFMANAVGTVIPTAAAALVAYLSAPLTLPAGASASVIAAASAAAAGGAALGTGTVMGAGIVKGSVFDAVSEELMKQGISEEEAEKVAQEAQAYGGENLDQIALGAILGAFASRAGLEPLLAKTLTKKVAENVAKRGVLKSAAVAAAQEAGPEALQGAQEQLARNIALGREEMVEAEVPLMRGVVGAGTLEGLAGGLAAGPLGALQASGNTEEVVDDEIPPVRGPEVAPGRDPNDPESEFSQGEMDTIIEDDSLEDPLSQANQDVADGATDEDIQTTAAQYEPEEAAAYLARIDIAKGEVPIAPVTGQVDTETGEVIVEEEETTRIKIGKKSPAALQTLSDIGNKYTRAPSNNDQFVGDGAAIEASVIKDRLHLSAIVSSEKGTGKASKLLTEIIQIADKNNTPIELAPVPFGSKDLNTEQLTNWYARYGFVQDGAGTMVRPPIAAQVDPETASLQAAGEQQAAVEYEADIVPDAKRSANVGGSATQPDPVYATFSNVRKAIDYIKKNTTNKLQRALANRLAPVMGNTQLVVVTDSKEQITNFKTRNLFNSSGTQAVYDEAADVIFINPETGMQADVILHEATHKGTAAKVTIYENDDSTNAGLTNKEVKSLDKIKSLMQEANKSFKARESAGNVTEADKNLADAGAFTNLYEFIAYGRTNAAMQTFLNGTSSSEGKNTLFSKFVTLLREFLNIPASQKNAFLDLVTASDTLIVAPDSTANAGQILAAKKIAGKQEESVAKDEKIIRNTRGGPKAAKKVLAAIGRMMNSTRNGDSALDFLRNNLDSLSQNVVVQLAKTLTTSDITRWIGNKVNGITTINDTVQEMVKKQNQAVADLAKKILPWVAFNETTEEGGRALSDMMNTATILQVDPSEYATASESIANDGKLKRLQASANEPGLSTAQQTSRNNRALKRVDQIRAVYQLWNRLGAYENKAGQRIYVMAKDAYKEIFVKHQALLIKLINDSTAEETVKQNLIASVVSQYQEANQLKVYFPLMRYGKFWIRVGKGANKEFYMFESQTRRNEAIDIIVSESDETEAEMRESNFLDSGNELKEAYQGNKTTAFLTGVFEAIDTAANSSEADRKQTQDMLKDQVYQMYLMSLPQGNMRKKFLRRKGTKGYGNDGLRNFITTQYSAIHQLNRMEFLPKLQLLVQTAKDSLNSYPDGQEKIKLLSLISEIGRRATNEASPTEVNGLDLNRLAGLGNQIAFIWLLTSPKSALIQGTQIPIVGMPILIAEGYGKRNVLKVMGRYSQLWNVLGTRKVDPDTGEVTAEWGQPSITDSKYVNDHPDPEYRESLKAAFQEGIDSGAFNATYAADVSARGSSPTDTYDSSSAKKWRSFIGFMGGMFHHSERLSREFMWMSTFELEFARRKAAGDTNAVAQGKAIAKAKELTKTALFDYSQYEKPTVMKNPVGKIAFQFMTYPLQMTSFLTRNFFNTFFASLPKEEKQAAATKFFGTIGMTSLFAGLVGVPGYSAIMGMAEGIRESFRPDEDDEDADPWYDENADGNPLGKRNLEYWFREWFLPNQFGEGSNFASFFGLTTEQAKLGTRIMKMGPVSALTDFNIGSSVKLDHLWFQDSVPSEDMKSAFRELLFNGMFGPLGAVGEGWAAGIDDMNAGDFNRGFEKLAPAFFRGPLKALRLSQEGSVTPSQRNEILEAEFYTIGKLLGQGLNFQSTTEAEIQRASFQAKQLIGDVKRERNKVLQRLNMAVARDMENPTDRTQANVDAALEAVDTYNYINGFNPIENSSINTSLESRAKKRAEANQGVSETNPVLRDILYDLVEPSRTN